VSDVSTNFGEGPVRDWGLELRLAAAEEDFNPGDEARMLGDGPRWDVAAIGREQYGTNAGSWIDVLYMRKLRWYERIGAGRRAAESGAPLLHRRATTTSRPRTPTSWGGGGGGG